VETVMSKDGNPFPILSPELQASFYYRLSAIRQTCLQSALRDAVDRADLELIDRELRQLVSSTGIKTVAKFGLRGELIFPVPALLRISPFLLGYYRLLYGFSQKEFYNKGPFGRFKRLEEKGEIPTASEKLLAALCCSLCQSGERLVESLDDLSVDIIHELQVMTLGPQFRGSENTRIGANATRQVYDLISVIVQSQIRDRTRRSIRLVNAAEHVVLLEFASDPDVLATEKHGDTIRTILSIEVKGGSDASNIHNRLGEAEKSHLKAKRLGCTDLWTIIRVDLPDEAAEAGSPTTTRFFNLDRIIDQGTPDFAAFRDSLGLRLGIRLD
jgi:hypothetical protein